VSYETLVGDEQSGRLLGKLRGVNKRSSAYLEENWNILLLDLVLYPWLIKWKY